MSEELKACPFCGNEPVLDRGPISARVECCAVGCEAYGPVHDTPAEAIAAWNRRTPSEPVSREAERIEGVAFLDGDAFCGEFANKGAACEGQHSYTFIPECEHERADEMLGTAEIRATLILRTPEPVTTPQSEQEPS